MNFAVLCHSPKRYEFNFSDTEKFLRCVHFHDKEESSDQRQTDEFESLKLKKSDQSPPDDQFTYVDLFVKKCRIDIQKLNFNKSLKFSNLSKEEWTAQQNLKIRDDIVIKLADKGGAVVVWRTDIYKQKALGLVYTMPDKFENATLLLRIRLPSTQIRIKRSTKTELFENALQSETIWKRYFFVLVWTENFLCPQLFEYADVILSCNLSSQVE